MCAGASQGVTMKHVVPTDIEAAQPRPDQAAAPVPQAMPTLADFGVPTRQGQARPVPATPGRAGVAAPRGK